MNDRGEDQLHGSALAHGSGHALGAAHPRDGGQVDLWLSKLDAVFGQAFVAAVEGFELRAVVTSRLIDGERYPNARAVPELSRVNNTGVSMICCDT